jgi:hypothetical protein
VIVLRHFEVAAPPPLRAWLRLRALAVTAVLDDVEARSGQILYAASTARAAARRAENDAARTAGYRGDIPWSVAGSSHAGTSHDPERRGQQMLDDYQTMLEHARERLEKAATTNEAKARVDALFEDYRAGLRARYSTWLSAHAGIMSILVTGRGNFPVERMRKKNDAVDRKREDMQAWSGRALLAMEKELKGTSLEAMGGPVAALEREIVKCETAQATWKAINLALRKKGTDDEKAARIVADFGYSEKTARKLLEPDELGNVGIPSYLLTNNNAQIKRLKERLTQEAARAVVEEADFPFEGGVVSYDPDAERLRVKFDSRVPREMYDRLKSSGFVFSHTLGTFQRKLTGNAVRATELLLGISLPALGD